MKYAFFFYPRCYVELVYIIIKQIMEKETCNVSHKNY